MNASTVLQIVAIIVSGLVGIGGLIIGIMSATRNSKGDTSAQAEWRGGVTAKLDTIMSQLKTLVGIPERVKALEDRVDALEKKEE